MSTHVGTSKATQVEYDICSDILTTQELSHAEEARVEELPERRRTIKKRVVELEQQPNLID